MKLLLLTAAGLFVACAQKWDGWEAFKRKYKKAYSPEEDVKRHAQYTSSLEIINNHNANYDKGNSTYKMAVNHFADWYPEEKERYLNYGPTLNKCDGEPFVPEPYTPAPEFINWVRKGAVTKVKDQGINPDASYAFSAVGGIEALMFKVGKNITNISAQELMDCFKPAEDEDRIIANYKYVINRNGIDTDATYPFLSHIRVCGVGECKADKGKIGISFNDYYVIKDEKKLKKAVGIYQPVSINFAADVEFFYYGSGIYDGKCNLNNNAALLVVGYGYDIAHEEDYWLIKNSWGSDWGEKGYVKVPRNINKCNIKSCASFPVRVQ